MKIRWLKFKKRIKKHYWDLCKKDKNIVQMKSTGQYICQNACDESSSDSSD